MLNRHRYSPGQRSRIAITRRKLHCEALEDRCMLATFTVTNLMDGLVNGPGDLPGSLRQAIYDANKLAGADAIEIDVSGYLFLYAGEMELMEAVTIVGPGTESLFISGRNESRIFNITSEDGDFVLSNMALIFGKTTGDNEGLGLDTTYNGGAVRSITSGELTISDAIVAASSTTGYSADGGGISARGRLTILNSIISGNRTEGFRALGGGILARTEVSITNSTITGNHTTGRASSGGGVFGEIVSLTGSEVTENYTTGTAGSGGGIAAFNDGLITVSDSLVIGNSTGGLVGHGGGIYAQGHVYLMNSTVSDNETAGSNARGGGVFTLDTVTSIESAITGNKTTGDGGLGGGIAAISGAVLSKSNVSRNNTTGDVGRGGGIWSQSAVFLTSSIVRDNHTLGDFADGGGIATESEGHITLIDSVVSENYTAGRNSDGGGIYAFSPVLVTVSGSTVSGNSATGSGSQAGGIYGRGSVVQLEHSTVVGNLSTDPGNGVLLQATPSHPVQLDLEHTILSGNGSESSPDFVLMGESEVSADFSLIGNTGGVEVPGNGSQIGVLDPMLGPLTDNGGRTPTHLPNAGSPAIDAGDPGFSGPIEFDQRGAPFLRVANGDTDGFARIDIGAVELQPTGDFNLDGLWNCADVDALVTEIVAATNDAAFDLNDDGLVDRLDLERWLALAGAAPGSPTGGNPFIPGDANLDTIVDGLDFNVWNDLKFTENNGWCGADFNADGVTDGLDVVIWNANRFSSANVSTFATVVSAKYAVPHSAAWLFEDINDENATTATSEITIRQRSPWRRTVDRNVRDVDNGEAESSSNPAAFDLGSLSLAFDDFGECRQWLAR